MAKTKLIATFDEPVNLWKVGKVVDLKYVFSVKSNQVGLWFSEQADLDEAHDALQDIGARVEQHINMPELNNETIKPGQEIVVKPGEILTAGDE